MTNFPNNTTVATNDFKKIIVAVARFIIGTLMGFVARPHHLGSRSPQTPSPGPSAQPPTPTPPRARNPPPPSSLYFQQQVPPPATCSDASSLRIPPEQKRIIIHQLLDRKRQKGDNDNFCLHLWELWMPHLYKVPFSTAGDGSATTLVQ